MKREMTLDEVIDQAVEEALCSAATMFRFASEVLQWDLEKRSTWVVHAALDNAEQLLRDAIDQGDDTNVVDARLSALRIRLGITSVRDIVNAGTMADDDPTVTAARILEGAAKACFHLLLNKKSRAALA